MSTAAFAAKWRKYRSARLYGTTMEQMIDADLKHPNPPSSDTIVELMLLGDTQYMSSMLQPTGVPSNQRGMSVAVLSRTPTHPFYKRVKNAFGYVNSRRKKAGLPLDKWPLPFRVPSVPPIPTLSSSSPPVRRLIWSLNQREVNAARGMFRRFTNDGLVPFRVGSNGLASERVTVFDPASCEMLFKPGDSK